MDRGCHGLVVAIDCAYHFHLDSFLSEAFKALQPGGLLRFSHVCGSVVGLGLLGVRTTSLDSLQRALSVNGFEDIDIRILPNVLERWNLAFGGRLTYVIVSARRPESDKPRPRVAIVGGGLSGLTSAFRLRRAGCAVTLFERAPSLGLSRNEWRGPHGTGGRAAAHGRRGLLPCTLKSVSGRFCSYYESDGRLLLHAWEW